MTKRNAAPPKRSPLKATVSIDNALSFELDADQLAHFAAELDDIDEHAPVFDALSRHPASRVRAAIVTKWLLSERAFALLASDAEAEVRRSLVLGDRYKELLGEDAILRLAASDADVAERIAGEVGTFMAANNEKIAISLCAYADPRVRLALAQNRGASKKALKLLLADTDRRVRATAQLTLGSVESR